MGLRTALHAGRRTAAVLTAIAIGSLVTSAGATGASATDRGGPLGHPTYGFDQPEAIAAAKGTLWIANLGGNSLTEVSSSGQWIRTLAAAKYRFRAPDAIAASAGRLFVVNRHGSVTELNATTGALIRVISGARYRFDQPSAITVDGGNVWIVNQGGNSLTEFRAGTAALVRVVTNGAGGHARFDDPDALTVAGDDIWVANRTGGSGTDPSAGSLTAINAATGKVSHHLASTALGLEQPGGIAFGGQRLWVSDSATNSVTELTDTGHLVQVITNSSNNSNYGFDAPSVVVAAAGNVYVISPPGSSPMITKVETTTANGDWYECNTNVPDPHFVNPTGLVVRGNHVWVVSPGNNSLAELHVSTGLLVKRFS